MLYINNKAVGITVVDKVQVPVEVPVEVIKYEDTPEEAQHKQDIKNAIINKGQSVSDDISEWASAINNISGGEGSGSGDSSEKIKGFIEGNYDVETIYGENDIYTIYRIPEGTTYIKPYCFSEAFISEIVIPNTVTKIGNCAFLASPGKKIIIPDSVTEMGYNAFANYGNYDWSTSKGAEIVLSKNLTKLPENCFNQVTCNKLEIPENVISFGNLAFANCRYLKTLIINSKETPKLEKSWEGRIATFNNSNEIEKIYVPNVSLYISSNRWDVWSQYSDLLENRYVIYQGATLSVNVIEVKPIKKAADTKTQAVIEIICPDSWDRCSDNPDELKTVSFKWTIDVEVPANETGERITQTVRVESIPGLMYNLTPFDVNVEHGKSTINTTIKLDGSYNSISSYEDEDTPLVWLDNWGQYYRQYEFINDNYNEQRYYNVTALNYSDSYVRVIIMNESFNQTALMWLQPGESHWGVNVGGEYKYVYVMQGNWNGNVENGIPQNIANVDIKFEIN